MLDKINILSNNDNFKFTSIIPKVSSKAKPLINGATINVDLSVDEDTLKSDFVKSDDKYKFYIDIYKKKVCSEEEEECTEDLEFIKTINTDYDNLSEVTFDGLDPDTIYYYKIAADMNKMVNQLKHLYLIIIEVVILNILIVLKHLVRMMYLILLTIVILQILRILCIIKEY